MQERIGYTQLISNIQHYSSLISDEYPIDEREKVFDVKLRLSNQVHEILHDNNYSITSDNSQVNKMLDLVIDSTLQDLLIIIKRNKNPDDDFKFFLSAISQVNK